MTRREGDGSGHTSLLTFVFGPLCLQRPSAVGSRLRRRMGMMGGRDDSGARNEAMSTEVGGSFIVWLDGEKPEAEGTMVGDRLFLKAKYV